MKICVLFCSLLFASAVFANQFVVTYNGGTPVVPGKTWVKIPELSDEFESWDGNKWSKVLWNYGIPVQMAAENAGVTDGNLWIKATLDTTSERWFKTSRVMSKAQVKFPMYTECRMKTANISAFSTYWLNNGDANNRDEIDICEHNTKPSASGQDDRPYQMYSQYFVVENGVTERDHAPRTDTRNLLDSNPAKGKKWNEDYQVLGCYWKDAHNVQFFINGEDAGSVTTTKAFTREQNIIWDLWTSEYDWTGGIAAKEDLADSSINTMYVDWIRTYTLVDAPDSIDDTINFHDTISEIIQSKEITASIDYNVSAEKDIVLALYDSSNVWIGSAQKTVNAGSGTMDLTIKLSDLPAIGKGYHLQVDIREKGGDWTTIEKKSNANINIVASTAISLQEKNKDYVQVYPNPIKDGFTVSVGKNSVGKKNLKYDRICLMNRNGVDVSTLKIGKNYICNITAGVYYVCFFYKGDVVCITPVCLL